MRVWLIFFTFLNLFPFILISAEDFIDKLERDEMVEKAKENGEIIVEDEEPFITALLGCKQRTALGCLHYARYLHREGDNSEAKVFLKRACRYGLSYACSGEVALTGPIKIPEIDGLVNRSTPVPTYNANKKNNAEDSKSKMFSGSKKRLPASSK